MSFSFFVASKTVFSKKKNLAGFILRLAIAAYALSIAVMIIGSSLVRGFKKDISNKMFGCWGHIHIVKAGSDRTFEQEPMAIDSSFYPSLSDLKNVEYQEIDPVSLSGTGQWITTDGGVKSIQVFANVPGIISNKEEFEGVILKGVDKEYDWSYFQKHMEYGRVPSFSDERPSSDLLISRFIADRLLLDTADRVILHFIRNEREVKRRFEICGIYNTGFSDFDGTFGLIDLRKAQQILGWDDNMVGGYEVFVDKLQDIGPINDYIYTQVIPSDLVSQSIRKKFPNIFDWLELQDINEWVIMGLMLVVAIINLVIMLLILILERMRLVGVLKALGANLADIRKVFLYKALIIMIVGAVIGNIVGIGLCLIQKHTHFIGLDQDNYFLSYAPIHIDPLLILLINIGAVALCLVGLILPSYLVKYISPTRILRFE